MLHVYSRLRFIIAQCLSCIFVPCRMQILTWIAVITESRSSRQEVGGIWLIARYSEGNERPTLVTVINDGRPSSSQLQRHLSTPSCSCSKRNGKGKGCRGGAASMGFSGNSPDFPHCYLRVICVYWRSDALWVLMKCSMFLIILDSWKLICQKHLLWHCCMN